MDRYLDHDCSTLRGGASGARLVGIPHLLRNIAASLFCAAGVLVIGLHGEARARTQADLVAELRCARTCLDQESSCQSGCCGIFLCRKRCLGACYDAEVTCEADCARQFGGTVEGAFFDTVTPGPHGRVIRVSGPLQCSAGATAELSVTVTQNGGPTAKGHVRLRCQEEEFTFTARTVVIGDASFQPLSNATACGVARIHAGNRNLKALQWCREVTVVPKGIELEE